MTTSTTNQTLLIHCDWIDQYLDYRFRFNSIYSIVKFIFGCKSFASITVFLTLFSSPMLRAYPSNASFGSDTIYLSKPGHSGVYTEEVGKVIKLSSSEIIVEIDCSRFLYKRDVVQLLKLDTNAHINKDVRKLANYYWNKEVPQIVKYAQQTPGIGNLVKESNKPVALLLSIVILICLFFFAFYKTYVFLVISYKQLNLNFDKLNMEVRKLRFELVSIEKNAGLKTRITEATSIEDIEKEQVSYGLKIPRIHIFDFIKYKVFRVLTKVEKEHRVEKWCVKWQKYKGKSIFRRWMFRFFLWIINWTGIVFFAMFGIGAFTDSILPFIDSEFLGVNPVISVIFFLFFIISTAFFIRLITAVKIINTSYNMTFKSTNTINETVDDIHLP